MIEQMLVKITNLKKKEKKNKSSEKPAKSKKKMQQKKTSVAFILILWFNSEKFNVIEVMVEYKTKMIYKCDFMLQTNVSQKLKNWSS